MTVRVLVADDHPLVRSGIRLVCEQTDDLVLVAEAGDGLEAVRLAADLEPDVVLMDIQMPLLDGVEATRRIVERAGSPAQVVMLTVHEDQERVLASLRAGARGYLLKDSTPRQVAAAARAVMAGDSMISPQTTRALIEAVLHGPPVPAAAAVPGLSQREVEVWRHVAKGRSDEEIARVLHIAPVTVRTHVHHLVRKAGVRNRTQLVIRAYETGIVRPGRA
jgi:DNA-binding NarL/FixJ family response regulator